MSGFITEKRTEEFLTLETRDLPMPDGTMKPFTGFKLMWRAYDFLIVCGKWSGKELVKLAILNSSEMGYSFEESFPAVLSLAHKDARKKMGID